MNCKFLYAILLNICSFISGSAIERNLLKIRLFVQNNDQAAVLRSQIVSNQQQIFLINFPVTARPGLILINDKSWINWKEKFLQKFGFQYEIVETNLKNAEQIETLVLKHGGSEITALPFKKISKFLTNLANQYEQVVELENIGNSYECRPIYLVKISSGLAKNSKKKKIIWVDATMHAREWITTGVSLKLIKKFATGYGNDIEVTSLVDKFDWYFVPVVNPDGYVYSWLEGDEEKKRYWRKNRQPQTCLDNGSTKFSGRKFTKPNFWVNGIDLNRNFDYHFAEYSVSSSACDDYTHQWPGEVPFSATEAKVLANKIEQLKHRIFVLFNLHSYMPRGTILLPPTVSTDSVTQNYPAMLKLAQKMSEAMKNKDTDYPVGLAPDIFGTNFSGDSISYCAKILKIPFVYAIELMDQDFITSETKIKQTFNTFFKALLAIRKFFYN